MIVVGTATEIGEETTVVRVDKMVVGMAVLVVTERSVVRVVATVVGTATVVETVTEETDVETIVVGTTTLVETARVVVPGTRVSVVSDGFGVGTSVSVAGDCGTSVVVAVGSTVKVVEEMVNVAVTLGSNVVVETGWTVSVVATNGAVEGRTDVAELCKVSVAVDCGTRVVACDGIMTTVDDDCVGFVGAMVSVAGTLGKRVVVDTGWTVKVVTTRGIDDAAVVGMLAVNVTGADVPNVVASEGTMTTVDDGSVETVGARVRVADTLAESVVGETGWTVSVVNTKGIEFCCPTVMVAGASGRRVDASVGTIVSVLEGWPEDSGRSVTVAG